MRLSASSALAPVIGAIPVLVTALIASDANPGADLMIVIVGTGMIPAVGLSMLATLFLQSDDLFEVKNSVLWCSLLGAFFAAVATFGVLGVSLYFWGVVAWGLCSGIVFRVLLGDDYRRVGRTPDE